MGAGDEEPSDTETACETGAAAQGARRVNMEEERHRKLREAHKRGRGTKHVSRAAMSEPEATSKKPKFRRRASHQRCT